jgi:hypothetical protein
VVDELLKDKGIVDALNKQFPADSELRKDLTALHWENLDAGTMQFINRNGRFIVGAKTEAGHSFGAYFNFTEREFQGQKRTMVVITSKFFAVDDLTEDDMYSVQSSPDSHTFGIEINLTGAHPKGTFFDLPPLLFGKFVDIN